MLARKCIGPLRAGSRFRDRKCCGALPDLRGHLGNSALDQATAMATLYTEFKAKISFLLAEHFGLMQRKEAELAQQDQAQIEEIILGQMNQGH